MTTVNETRLYATTDAVVWAEEFKKVCPDVDEGLMIGWFANAFATADRAATPAAVPEPDDFDFFGGFGENPSWNHMALVAYQCFDTAVAHGWWDDKDTGKPLTSAERKALIMEKLVLMHSELSEALEEYRDGRMATWFDDDKGHKPEGFWVECADTIVRIFDLAGGLDAVDTLIDGMRLKMQFNEGREYRHGNKRA